MLKKILLSVSIVSMVIVGTSFASVSNTMTTKGYVDTEIDKKQLTIPAAGTPGVGAGETVVTYTATAGEIGERALFTGGEYNANTDSDKLITASALKSAFTLPETQTTKLTCANPGTCDLWTITEQTAYGRAGGGCPDLMSLIGNVEGEAFAYITNDGVNKNSVSTYGLTQNGTFVVDYGDGKMIRGKSQCSNRDVANIWYYNNNTFESDHFTTTFPDANGEYCYCTLDGYTTTGGSMQGLSAPWVFGNGLDDAGYCANSCAVLCAGLLRFDDSTNLAFRAAVFASCGM